MRGLRRAPQSGKPQVRKHANEQEIIEGLKPICICKGIRASVFRKHIHTGVTTVENLRKATGAGRGACKGERCTPRIEELLRKEGK